MKVMQINCVYKKGSTGKIVYDIHTELKKQGIESIVCYGRGKKIVEENVYKTSTEFLAKFNNVKSRFTGMPYNGSFFATNKLFGIIKKEKPDVVHLHCINGYFVNIYRLLKFLKKHSIPTVVTHHAEFMYTGYCAYAFECEKWKYGCNNCPHLYDNSKFDQTKKNWKKMKKATDDFRQIISVAVSPWVQSRAEKSVFYGSYKNTTVMNGIDCDTFKLHKDAGVLKNQLGIPETKKVLIHVTASFSNPIKGGNYILDLAKRLDEETIVIIVGNNEDIENLPENILLYGRTENQEELAKLYSMADLCILASHRETFSMPVAESLCCGTPVVGFLAGGPESITIEEYSKFVEYGNVDELEKAVKVYVDMKQYSDEISKKAIEKYNKKNMCKNYINIYKEVLENGRN